MYYRSHGNWWLLHHYLISVALVLRLFCVTQKRSSVVAMDTGGCDVTDKLFSHRERMLGKVRTLRHMVYKQ